MYVAKLLDVMTGQLGTREKVFLIQLSSSHRSYRYSPLQLALSVYHIVNLPRWLGSIKELLIVNGIYSILLDVVMSNPVSSRIMQNILIKFIGSDLYIPRSDITTLNHSKFLSVDAYSQIPHFKYVSKVSEGSYGCVYRVIVNHQDFAIKIQKLKPNAIVEVAAISMLIDIGIVRINRVSIAKDHLYTLMPYYNTTLFDLVSDPYKTPEQLLTLIKKPGKGPLDKHIQTKIILDITRACSYMHSRGIIHGDLKLENILITTGNQIKIIDFGLSSVYSLGKNVKRKGNNVCTIQYRPFDIVNNRYSSGVDIWSLGVIFSILECGFHPYMTDCPAQNYSWLTIDRYKLSFIEDLDLREIILSMLAYNEEDRPAASELLK